MMIKKLVSIIFAVILVFGINIAAYAEEQKFVFDEADVLTYHEVAEFEGRANILYQTWGCEVYIITYESLMGYEAWELNELLYQELVSEYGAGKDVIMLLLAMEERQYDILAHGYGNTAFTDYGKDVMAERFLDNFGNDDWYGGFSDYLDTCEEFLKIAAYGEPFDIGSAGNSAGANILGVLVAIVISCVIALVVCFILRAQMKTARIATEAHDYAKQLNIKDQYDRFSHRDIQRVYIPPQENNNGGGTTINSGGFSHKSGGF